MLCGLSFKQKYEVIGTTFYEALPVVQDRLEKLEVRVKVHARTHVCFCVMYDCITSHKTNLQIFY